MTTFKIAAALVLFSIMTKLGIKFAGEIGDISFEGSTMTITSGPLDP